MSVCYSVTHKRLKRAILDVYKVSGAVKKATDSLTEKDRKAIKGRHGFSWACMILLIVCNFQSME